ncbi:hypothetical protein FJTKL_05611 [Diaporthe vaccinii]|uniref:Uncharacterized protein n=1 Tax=Diaporthe vaccinii TaxID=105482 RepID=A0ABR4DRR3_9PEZI
MRASLAPDITLYEPDVDDLHDGNLNPPEYYLDGIESLDMDEYQRKEYAKGTEKLIRNAEDQWSRFCTKVLWKRHSHLKSKGWKHQLRHIEFPTIYQFLNWHLSQRTGKSGRRKRPTRSKQSLITFWCCFRLAFQRAANWKINLKVNRNLIHNGLAKLVKEHKLTHKTRENRSMSLQDLKNQIDTTLRTTEKGFKLGELRVLAVLFLLLLAPQGSRPASILQMRFGDVQVVLIRDLLSPKGPPRLVIKCVYTKNMVRQIGCAPNRVHPRYRECINTARQALAEHDKSISLIESHDMHVFDMYINWLVSWYSWVSLVN